MESRNLGKTFLVVSRLGLGLAALGRPGYINLGHADDLGQDYDATAMIDKDDKAAAMRSAERYLKAIGKETQP